MLNELSKAVHDNAVAHGWWENERPFGEVIALIHQELSEALEEYRHGHEYEDIYYKTVIDYSGPSSFSSYKPEGIPVELADVIIRILDFCGAYDIDIDRAVQEKMKFNETRPYRHGGLKA